MQPADRLPSTASAWHRRWRRLAAFGVLRLVLFVALWVALVVLLAGEGGLAYRRGEDTAERGARTLAFASELRALGDRELNAVLYLSS